MSLHTVTCEQYAPASWSVPEGGPEMRITFQAKMVRNHLEIFFVRANWTHDGSLIRGEDAVWAREWLIDNDSRALIIAQMERSR